MISPRRMFDRLRMISVVTRSRQSACSASIAAVICQGSISRLGRFWGWNSRPPHRPVRMAPQKAVVPRRTWTPGVSTTAELISVLYFAVEVVLVASRTRTSCLRASGSSGFSSWRSRVSFFRSGR